MAGRQVSSDLARSRRAGLELVVGPSALRTLAIPWDELLVGRDLPCPRWEPSQEHLWGPRFFPVPDQDRER